MKKLIAIVFAFLLVSCTHMAPVPSAPKMVYDRLPDNLLVKCYITPPPDAKTYVLKSADEKLSIMSTYSTTLLGDLDTCNIRLSEIRIANDRKDKLYNPGSGSK